MQPSCKATIAFRSCCFSTLYGSKWVATSAAHDARTFAFRVSVPSTGRSGLQRQVRIASKCAVAQFQYPLRVEVGCNEVAATCSGSLSVCFSTLYGSKWVATPETAPPRGKESCFSTLYGSKWVATRLAPVDLGVCLRFQYPLRVEVGCNLALGAVVAAWSPVSVPSTGRSGLQRGQSARDVNSVTVSVPSTGRSGLQLPDRARAPARCTWVSVPSTGRSGLQP